MQLFWVLKPSQYLLHMVWLRNEKIIFNYARLSLGLFLTQSTVIVTTAGHCFRYLIRTDTIFVLTITKQYHSPEY